MPGAVRRRSDGLTGSQGLWWLTASLMCGALISPMLVVDAPPLLDYLNHLARISILASSGDQIISRMYAPHWAIIPNLGLDLMLPPVLRVMPVLTAGKLAVSAVILLPVLGTIAYSGAVHRTSSFWSLGVCLVAYNETVLLGFMNFLAAAGLAMLLAAFWIRWRDTFPIRSTVLCVVGVLGLFFCHLMGVILFLALTLSFELESIWRHPETVLRRVLTWVPMAIGPCVLYLLSPLQAVSGQTLWLPARDKAVQLLAPVIGYNQFLDGLTAAVIGLSLLGFIVCGSCRIPPHALIAISVLLILYAASPFIIKGTCFLDTRFVIILGYLMFGAVLPTRLDPRVIKTIALICICVFAWRMTTIGETWHAYQQDIDDMRATISDVQPGDRVYVTSVAPAEAPDYWQHGPRSRILWTGLRLDYHLAALLVLEHRAFWPFLFTDPTQQPVMVLEPYRRLAEVAGPMLAHRDPQATSDRMLCGYDYVLLLNAGGEPDVAQYGRGRLDLVYASDAAALFRIGSIKRRDPPDRSECRRGEQGTPAVAWRP